MLPIKLESIAWKINEENLLFIFQKKLATIAKKRTKQDNQLITQKKKRDAIMIVISSLCANKLIIHF
jgi:hypothetical protein